MMEQILREQLNHLRSRRDTSASICRLLTISQKMTLVASHLAFSVLLDFSDILLGPNIKLFVLVVRVNPIRHTTSLRMNSGPVLI